MLIYINESTSQNIVTTVTTNLKCYTLEHAGVHIQNTQHSNVGNSQIIRSYLPEHLNSTDRQFTKQMFDLYRPLSF